MAVFTKLSEADFKSIIASYDIGAFISSEGIAEGIENTNYKLATSEGNFIFTIYEKRVKKEDLPFFINLQKKLNQSSFPCPMPIASKNGNLINSFNDKNFTIVTFLNGKWPKSIGNNEVAEAGKVLGMLHNTSAKFNKNELFRANSMSTDFWVDTYSKIKTKAESHFKDLGEIAKKGFKLVNDWPLDLPSGIIHADFFPDNVLFFDNKVSGVIDFYMACNDMFAYDLAITLNSWCFEKDHSFNITKAKLLLKSYNEIRKLSEAELEKLPILCVGACLRFLSTRLYDYFNRSGDAVVSVKDPREYMEKLKFHLQIKSHLEYGL